MKAAFATMAIVAVVQSVQSPDLLKSEPLIKGVNNGQKG